MDTVQIARGPAIPLVNIPLGEFLMGSERGLPLELPVHRVRISRPFWIGKFPVTQAQWTAVMGSNPSYFRGPDELPVENVSWDDATAFCAKLTTDGGRLVRLPSEAEWEYACRAGTQGEFFFGDSDRDLAEFAWFDLNSSERTHPVAGRRPNPWGLGDMVGNVWEWCVDVWHSDYAGAPIDGSPWLDGEVQQPRRSLRGGAWSYDAFRCRCAYRSREWKRHRADDIGFRIVAEG